MNDYDKMMKLALTNLNPRKFNRHAKSGDAVCVLLAKNKKYYVGQSLVATCGLGYCAEQAAISQMINDGETKIESLLVIDKFNNILTPCGKCCEMITQINDENYECTIMLENDERLLLRDIYRIDWKRIKASGFNKKDKEKYNLRRFLDAQKYNYADAVQELKKGKKETHWMSYVFPQILGTGKSDYEDYFSIRSIDEAKGFFSNVILSNRYNECIDILMKLEMNVFDIFGVCDSLKLKSSISMAYLVTLNDRYLSLLNKFFNGELCEKTLQTIKEMRKE